MLISTLFCLAMTAAPAKVPRGPVPAISADGKRLFVADGKRSIGIYDAKSLELVSELKNVLPEGPHFIMLSPSGKLMLITATAGEPRRNREQRDGRKAEARCSQYSDQRYWKTENREAA